MTTAAFVSLHLARFDQLRAAGPADPGERPGLVFGTWHGADPVAVAHVHGQTGEAHGGPFGGAE